MSPIFDFLFGQYSESSSIDIILELVAVFFGLLSVIFSWRNNILVFPAGMISTAIFVYLLLKWALLGDMMINGYYFMMSVYGWYIWTRKVNATQVTPITRTSVKEHKISAVIFVTTLLFVFVVYQVFDKWNSWTAYVDTITTGL
jgi:nicotinamide mononucleotide transporter